MKLILIVNFLMISGCVSRGLDSKILFDDQIPSFDCVKQAIKKTEGVKFTEERIVDDSSVCLAGHCRKKAFYAHYSINGWPTNYRQAFVVINKTYNDHLSIGNVVSDRFGVLTESEKSIGQKALDLVSENISHACTGKKGTY